MKQILIIDDESQIRLVLKKMLVREGFSVISASDGKEGMKLFKKDVVDLVITDIIMPEKEGVEVIMELKKDYPDVPIIAISGGGQFSSKHYLDMAKLLGVNAIFDKPIYKDELLKEVKKCLKF